MKKSMVYVRALVLFALVFLVFLGVFGAFPIDDAAAQARPALVRDVDNPALQPERLAIFTSTLQNESYKATDSITVPGGKRLVIENASLWCFVTGNDRVTGVWLKVKNQSHYILLDPATNEARPVAPNNTVMAYNRVIKAYFNAGETVQVEVYTEGSTSSKLVNVYLQGYYINVP
jgi:hypothetical protein